MVAIPISYSGDPGFKSGTPAALTEILCQIVQPLHSDAGTMLDIRLRPLPSTAPQFITYYSP